MSKEAKTWLVMGCAALGALAGEAVTVMVWGYPMSHAMLEAPKIAVFVVGLIVGGLACHFWWPARSRWLEQDRYIEHFGNPGKLRVRVGTVWDYAEGLWSIHRAKGPALKEKP